MTDGWHVPSGDYGAKRNRLTDDQLNEAVNKIGENAGPAASAKRKTGSAMSDKQIARAAVDGQRMIFRTVAFTPVDGYVVGMDDFHWLIATPGDLAGEPVTKWLVHKTCPLVSFTDTYLEDEPEEDRTEIQRIGRPFWENCVRNNLVRPMNQEPQK